MKKILNAAIYAVLLAGAVVITSCQEEFEDVNTSDEGQESFVATSSTADLMQRTAYRDGSFDNIVDGSSCFALNFPYTVNANGLDITVDSLEDLRLIEEIFDEFDDDDDSLEILFPIKVTLADYSEITLDSPEALRELGRECVEGGRDDDIECIDFVYPITFFTFNTDQQQTGTVTVNSDRELRYFFRELDDDDFVSLEYPITLVKHDGTEVRVNNNAELRGALELARDACDEDDDDDYNDDDFDEDRLESLLTSCRWVVLTVERNSEDQTAQYEAFLMTFLVDGTVRVRDREGNLLVGEWDLDDEDEYVELDLEFDTLVDFNLEWKVYEIEEGKIKLFSGEGNRIIMKRTCDDPAGGEDSDVLEAMDILMAGDWVVAQYTDDGMDETADYGPYDFTFGMAQQLTVSTDGNTVKSGTWRVVRDSEGMLKVYLDLGDDDDDDLSELTDDWDLISIDATQMELKDVSGGDGSEDNLVFIRK